MNILFDINHPVDVNFFKNAMLKLKDSGHDLYIIYRGRGKLEMILKYELKMFHITKIGNHNKKGFIKKITSQLKRDYNIVPYIKKNKIELVVCFGSTSAISTKLCSIPYLAFDDDFEYKIPFYHANWFATRHIFPDFIKFSNSRTYKYHSFKELAYLHPNYLKTSEEVLKEYDIFPNKYVFIREIANVSLNYSGRISILKAIMNKIKKRGLSIVLSLEDKNLTDLYRDDCIILEEPISDIYSLMNYALFAISSGDTVARETALLGIPTIYTGGRSMIVNSALIDNGLLYEQTDLKKIEDLIKHFTMDKKNENQNKISNHLKSEWEDTTKVILEHINHYIN